MIYNMGSGILRGMGDSRWPLIFLIFCSVMNVVLDLVFVIYLNMGVAGVAWALSLIHIYPSNHLRSSSLCHPAF